MFVLDNLLDYFIIYLFRDDQTNQEASYKLIPRKVAS